jgi:quinolinate synthase
MLDIPLSKANMLELFPEKDDVYMPTISESELSDADVLIELRKIKEELKDRVIVLGHHYQQDDVIEFADITGDSLQLAREAAKLDIEYIIFCGVHFMAETADMLTKP